MAQAMVDAYILYVCPLAWNTRDMGIWRRRRIKIHSLSHLFPSHLPCAGNGRIIFVATFASCAERKFFCGSAHPLSVFLLSSPRSKCCLRRSRPFSASKNLYFFWSSFHRFPLPQIRNNWRLKPWPRKEKQSDGRAPLPLPEALIPECFFGNRYSIFLPPPPCPSELGPF